MLFQRIHWEIRLNWEDLLLYLVQFYSFGTIANKILQISHVKGLGYVICNKITFLSKNKARMPLS